MIPTSSCAYIHPHVSRCGSAESDRLLDRSNGTVVIRAGSSYNSRRTATTSYPVQPQIHRSILTSDSCNHCKLYSWLDHSSLAAHRPFAAYQDSYRLRSSSLRPQNKHLIPDLTTWPTHSSRTNNGSRRRRRNRPSLPSNLSSREGSEG